MRGADINAKMKQGSTALTFASFNGHREIVKLLLAGNADINAKTEDGRTALSMASEKDRQEVKELLLRAGAK